MIESRLMTRRQALMAAGAAMASATLAGRPGFAQSAGVAGQCDDAGWLSLLARSERGGRDYAPRIEGELPSLLNGVLYRNGPGLFERNGYRKSHLLDGDGLVQRLDFTNGTVRYQNRFVDTPKLAQEEEAGRFLYPTWTTLAPPPPESEQAETNILSQAGVTVYAVGDRVYALDETNPAFELDPVSLETRRPLHIDGGTLPVGPKAHAKIDPETGDWMVVGQTYDRNFTEHFFVYDEAGNQKQHLSFQSPRNVYYHDFLATKNYAIFILHPCIFSPREFLQGATSFVGSLNWQSTQSNLVAVLPRDGGDVRYFEAPASFMWHGLNAYEQGNSIVADFVSYDEPDMFIGDDALFYNIMNGCAGRASSPGKLRRYTIDLAGGALSEEIIDHGSHEFPMIDPRNALSRHDVGYLTHGTPETLLETGIKRFDYRTGEQQLFDFGRNVYVGEPVFAPTAGGGTDDGWLMSLCLDGQREQSFYAVFDASNVSAGPTAKIWLEHHMPISFHGWWRSRT